MKELTKAEEQIMQVLWKLEKAFVKEIIPELPDPKPAYSTVATVIKILEEKKFVGHQAFGKTHQYFPQVQKDIYAKDYLNNVVDRYFGNSYHQLVSFFMKKEDLSLQELEEIKALLDKDIRNKKKG